MLIAVLHQDDGTIVQTMMGQKLLIEHTANSMGLKFLAVEEDRNDYDTHFCVVDGKLALKATITEAN